MKLYLGMMCFAVLAVCAAVAQQKKAVPPPPKPAEEGPSLEVTMKFIQDKVNQEGSIASIQSNHNTITGESGGPWKHSTETSVVEVDPGGGLSLKTVHAWPAPGYKDTFTWRLHFKDVGKLEVLSKADQSNRQNAKKGTPEWVVQYDPPSYELIIYMASGKAVPVHTQKLKGDKTAVEELDEGWGTMELLAFRDEETANHVAKAMVHAVELCGGGAKPEPF